MMMFLQKLEDVVHVDVVDEKQKLQRYSLSNLKELQSKLMLVAGKAEKGKEDVDKFVEVGPKSSGISLSYNNSFLF